MCLNEAESVHIFTTRCIVITTNISPYLFILGCRSVYVYFLLILRSPFMLVDILLSSN